MSPIWTVYVGSRSSHLDPSLCTNAKSYMGSNSWIVEMRWTSLNRTKHRNAKKKCRPAHTCHTHNSRNFNNLRIEGMSQNSEVSNKMWMVLDGVGDWWDSFVLIVYWIVSSISFGVFLRHSAGCFHQEEADIAPATATFWGCCGCMVCRQNLAAS